MTLVGNRPILKIYPDTGHFIHTDNPVEFSADVVNFVTTGTLDTSSPLEIDHLINRATASAATPSAPSRWRPSLAAFRQFRSHRAFCTPARRVHGDLVNRRLR